MVEGPSAAIGQILAVGSRPSGSNRIILEGGPRPNEPTLRWRSRAHSIGEIEQELARMWSEPNLETTIDGETGRHVAARTSVMNLVVIAHQPEIGQRAAATIQQLTGRHPSRTVIVSPADPDGPSWLDAAIQAHCVLPREDAPETCAELIYLTVGGESGRHLDSVVAPLLIHDLPVTVWVPGEPRFEAGHARPILEMANRLVVDSSTWSEHGLDRLRQMALLLDETDIAITDFALTRQSRWREAIASIFDLPDFRPFLGGLRRISVAYATHHETGVHGSTNVVKPVYHVAWIASRLGFRVVQPLAPAREPSRPGRASGGGASPAMSRGLTALLRDGRHDVQAFLRPIVSPMPAGTTLRVELLAGRRGSELRADVTAVQDSVHVRVWLDGVEDLDRVFPAPRRTEVDLLAEAIEGGGRDSVTVGALRLAAELGGAERQRRGGDAETDAEAQPESAGARS